MSLNSFFNSVNFCISEITCNISFTCYLSFLNLKLSRLCLDSDVDLDPYRITVCLSLSSLFSELRLLFILVCSAFSRSERNLKKQSSIFMLHKSATNFQSIVSQSKYIVPLSQGYLRLIKTGSFKVISSHSNVIFLFIELCFYYVKNLELPCC